MRAFEFLLCFEIFFGAVLCVFGDVTKKIIYSPSDRLLCFSVECFALFAYYAVCGLYDDPQQYDNPTISKLIKIHKNSHFVCVV